MVSNSDWELVENIVTGGSQFIENTKVRGGIAAALAGVTLGKMLYDRYQEWRASDEYSILIHNNFSLEAVVDSWISSAVSDDDIPTINLSVLNPHLRRKSKNPRQYVSTSISNDSIFGLVIDGYDVVVYKRVTSGRDHDGPTEVSDGGGGSRPATTTVITCESAEARKHVVEKLNEGVYLLDGGRPNMYVSDRYGDFDNAGWLPRRPLDSVVFSNHQKERILDSITDFYTREDEYTALGIPYHHGILLHGPPGTGKTSIVTALGTHMSMDVYTINMSSVANDESLMDLVRATPGGSFLLLEDVDIASGMAERTSEVSGVTMSGILNVLDGLITPAGVVIILTSNDISKIDPAIVRPGRIDLEVRVDYMDDEQLHRLCSYFLGFVPQDLPSICTDDMIVPADIVGCIKTNFGNTEASAKAIVNEIWRKKSAILSTNLPLQN